MVRGLISKSGLWDIFLECLANLNKYKYFFLLHLATIV